MYPIPLFMSTTSASVVTATSITTSSIGIAIVGGKKQLTYTVTPEDGALFDIAFSSSDNTKMVIDNSGMMEFVAEGGFDAIMTAKNNLGAVLTDQSGGYASELSVYTESLSAMDVGTTQQLVATISPEGAKDLPDMVITYTTTDPEVATVSPTGLITALKDGGCRIGCTATYQGTVVASDSSYLGVNAIPVISNVTAVANSYGDVRVAWDVADPLDGDTYTVEVLDLSDNSVQWTTTTTNTYAYFDISDSIPLYGFAPTYLKINVKSTKAAAVIFNNSIATDDSFIKEVIVFAGQDNVNAHFTELSGANKAAMGSTTARNAYATQRGLANAEVLPLNTASGSSAADKYADDKAGTGTPDNYWYDLDNTADGPCLTNFITKVTPYASKVKAIIWGQGENDAVSASSTVAGRYSNTTRYHDATIAIFDKMRTIVPASQAKIVWQILGRSYLYGVEVNGVDWQKYRNVQRTISTARDDVIIGSWVDGAERYSGYVYEEGIDGRIHYVSSVYQTAATKLAKSAADGTDLTSTSPVWVDMAVPTGATATSQPNQDTILAWDAQGYSKHYFRNINVLTASVLTEQTLNTNSYTFTYADQVEQYGFAAGTTIFDVAYYDEANDVLSPLVRFNVNVTAGTVEDKPVVMDYDLTQETLPSDVKVNGGNSFARASGDKLVATNTLVAPLEYVGTTPVGRRVTANTATQIFVNNALTSASPWIKTKLTVAASSDNSPAGTTANVFKLTPTTTSGSHILTATYTNAYNISAGRNWSASVFLKANGITKAKLRLKAGTEVNEGTFDLAAGTFTGSEANIISMGNGWYRAILHKTGIAKQSSISFEIIALDATGAEIFAGDGTSNLAVWLPQLEGASTGETSKAGSPYVCIYPGNLGGVSFTIPRNGHTGVDVYYSNGDVVRDVFSGTASTWTINYSSLYDWGSVFITGLKYYD
ncbi:tail protein [Escherichia phage alia]|uniref:BIG2 domain-containing protein n=1 Tax=Escherichia phage alia TaxID=2696379 RepID=A0A6B9X4H6_9CAUD|nr:tail protein [Escherichia phage alia]QHR73747.1 hypothetical protein alia_33 [Escherichia phage alia]